MGRPLRARGRRSPTSSTARSGCTGRRSATTRRSSTRDRAASSVLRRRPRGGVPARCACGAEVDGPVARRHARCELASGERVGWDTLVATAALSHLAALTVDLPGPAREAARAAARRGGGQPQPRRAGPGAAPRALALRAGGALPVLPRRLPVEPRPASPRRAATPSRSRSACQRRGAAGRPARALPGRARGARAAADRGAVEVVAEARIDPAYVVFDVARPRPSRRCATPSAPPGSCSPAAGRSGSTRRWRTRCGTAPPRRAG